MNPVRRRKKRPNNGVRTVEVNRGKNGFGFTISGQHPCILSCIVAGSPAESAGLRAGDYLVAVEGQSVSKVPHNEVVRLIGACNGVLKLHIAENFYSDSSDDETVSALRQKPKYPHKYRSNGRGGVPLHNRSSKSVQDVQCDMFNEPPVEAGASGSSSRNLNPAFDHWRLSNRIPPPTSRFQINSGYEIAGDVEEELFRAIVGYVGTIEMPRKLPHGSRLQIVRGCIKKLRAEKRNHTAVLLRVMTRSLRLINGAGITLAVYPGERVTFCGASSDKDQQHFGVVTTAVNEDPSSSCHIFAVDPRPHATHSKRAKIFKLECHIDPISGICQEFPLDSGPIIAAIRGFYDGNSDEPLTANSPQPSHDSTTTSNSDSGIGFRDDCGNQSDRILVVDVPNQRLHIQEMDEASGDKLTVRALPVGGRSSSPLSTGSDGHVYLEDMSVSSGNTKSPNITAVSNHHNYPSYSRRSIDDMSISSARSNDCLPLTYKVSPKMLGLPLSHSLEDLKNHQDMCPNPLWGSLQDLRSFAVTPYQSSEVDNPVDDSEDSVSVWAGSFEKLLEDTVGLHKFAEFLKKEFSHENIIFWVSCERYRLSEDLCTRRKLGCEIHKRHLAPGALEPVNVDSHARQITQQQLSQADPNLFFLAQKQIYNLMKFDCYPRFIKSDIYKECVMKVLSGEPVVVKENNAQLLISLNPQSPAHAKLKKSRSDAEERRRKSLLPWTRKSRAKSRDRVSNDNLDHIDNASVSSSRSSLTAWDITLSSGLSRVILHDGSSAVIHTRPGYSVKYVILRLLDKRALLYSDFYVFLTYNNKQVDVQEDSTSISGQEVRVEQIVVFKLDLPNRKTIVVKSKYTKTLGDVVGPILMKYDYHLKMVTLCLMSENEVVDLNVPVSVVDNQRIQVLTRNVYPEGNTLQGAWRADNVRGKGKSLDEITNRVFEELLQEKAQANINPTASDQCSVRSDDWGSENSSGIIGRFLRRDSAYIDKNRKFKKTAAAAAAKCEESDKKTTLSKLPPLIAKLKPSHKVDSRSESDVLYEGLKRAQRSRLEDQRGTEINFELPDFLKDKENTPKGGKKLRTLPMDLSSECHFKMFSDCTMSNLNASCRTSRSSTALNATTLSEQGARPPRLSDPPPPLPPKPKNILENSWIPTGEPKPRPRTLRSAYLDQPSSSFV